MHRGTGFEWQKKEMKREKHKMDRYSKDMFCTLECTYN